MKGDQAFKETHFDRSEVFSCPLFFLQGDVHEPGFAQWTYMELKVCSSSERTSWGLRTSHFGFVFFLKLWNKYWQGPSVICSQAFRQFYILDGEDVCMPQDQTSNWRQSIGFGIFRKLLIFFPFDGVTSNHLEGIWDCQKSACAGQSCETHQRQRGWKRLALSQAMAEWLRGLRLTMFRQWRMLWISNAKQQPFISLVLSLRCAVLS